MYASDLHHFCKECNSHYGPASDTSTTLCPKPRCKGRRFLASGELDVLCAVIFDHAKRVREMWADPTMARLLMYPRERTRAPGEIRDSWDGTILCNDQLKDFTQESEYNLVWDYSSDAAIIEVTDKKSYTPLNGRCHNTGPHVRSQLTQITMFGMAGPGFTNYQPVIDLALVQVMKANGPGTEGIECKLSNGQTIWSKQAVAFNVDDTRGVHHTSMQKQSPAYVGACKECTVLGVRVPGISTQYYPSACSMCESAEARRRYQEIHAEDVLQDVADAANAPTKMNHAKALAAGRAAEEKGADKTQLPYHGQRARTLVCIRLIRIKNYTAV